MADNTIPPKFSPARLLATIFLVLIFLVGLAVLIVWLSIKPKRLIYSIENGSVHNYNFTNNHLTADFNFTVRAHNPNRKVSVYYDRIDTKAFYDDDTIALTSIEPFHQPSRNVTHLRLYFSAKDVVLSESAARELRMERARGRMNVEIKVKGKVRFKVGAFKTRHHTLRVTCGPVTLPFSFVKNFETTICDVDL